MRHVVAAPPSSWPGLSGRDDGGTVTQRSIHPRHPFLAFLAPWRFNFQLSAPRPVGPIGSLVCAAHKAVSAIGQASLPDAFRARTAAVGAWNGPFLRNPCIPRCRRTAAILTIPSRSPRSRRGDQKTGGRDRDSRLIRLSPARFRQRRRRPAGQSGRRGKTAGGRPQPDPDDEAAPRRARALVDLGAIAELRGVRRDGDSFVIGATTTMAS